MNIIVSILLTLLTSLSLSGCNTIKGAGKDIKAGGQNMENAAERTQHRNPNTNVTH